MKKNVNSNSASDSNKEDEDLYEFPGYPLYPRSEDIYNRSKEEQNVDPEDITQLKEGKKKNQHPEDKELNSLNDLDVPGAELDDEDEKVGSEDEENNYYSLGGDVHDDLEEDKGD